ncbi:hypothetical protein PMG11_01386 [Penicillium brasilianum]|nr:hypothetical protein PMG11_01386 [Penicillium brasilianum]
MWRKLRAAQGNSEPALEEDSLEPDAFTTEEFDDLDQPTPSTRKPSASAVGLPSDSQVPKDSGRDSTRRKRSKRASMELSRVSCDQLDPFQCYISSSPLPSGLVSNSNKYCLSVLWPGLMPKSSIGGVVHAGIEGWFSSSLGHPALHSAMLFGSYSHRRIMWLQKKQSEFSADDEKQMSICEADSIMRINRAIQSPSEAITDAIILCVLCMANNKNEPPLGPDFQESPFQSPLRSLQWLDVYGRLKPHPIHQAGLVQLVYLKGGLQTIKLPGLAGVISFSDVLAASRSLSQPLFPCISLQEGEFLTLNQIINFQHPMLNMDIDIVSELPITSEMQEIFSASRAYLALIDRYQDGVYVALEMLADFRNLVQWHIMSLLPGSKLGPNITNSYPLYEACRLALVIMGLGVIFPLPPQSAPLLELSQMLQAQLQSVEDIAQIYSSVSIKLMYWCLILGGIAAGESQERLWYGEELRRLAGPYGLPVWNEVKRDLKTILWLDRACDFGGRIFWEEALCLR